MEENLQPSGSPASPPSPSPGPSPGDEFQKRLRDLGYLKNPLEKFFIGGGHGRTGVVKANLAVAAKVGLFGGVFLGVLTAIGFALLAPTAFAGLGAVARLALFFSVLFAIVFGVLQLAIGMAVSLLGKLSRRLFTRTQMVALYSGVFVGLAVFIYGTLWWWWGTAAGGKGEVLSAVSIGVLAVVALLAAGLSYLTRLGVLALLARLGGADLGAHGKGRATRLYAGALVAGIAIFVGFHFAARDASPSGPSAYEVEPTGLSVTIIAIDGLDEGMLTYIRSGGNKGSLPSHPVMPNIVRLYEGGYSTRLLPSSIQVNPSVWTTVATGVGPRKHGVTSFAGQEIPGLGLYVKDEVGFGLYDAMLSVMPKAGLSRRVALKREGPSYPSLWDVLAQKGRLCGVSNWWNTWPAADFHGYMVTDRMYPKLQAAKALGRDAAFEREAFPRSLFDALKGYAVEAEKAYSGPYYVYFDSSDNVATRVPASNAYVPTVEQNLDRFVMNAALAGRREYPQAALTAVYLPGYDIMKKALSDKHPILIMTRPVSWGGGYEKFLDDLLRPLLSEAGPDHVVIVVGDSGMPKAQLKPAFGNPVYLFLARTPWVPRVLRSYAARRTRVVVNGADVASRAGFMIMAGGPVKQDRGGLAAQPARLVDIAPTVLYLLGFPVSEEMDGRVLTEALDGTFLRAHPVRMVDTFGRVEAKTQGAYSVDAQLVERLKSLGYLR